jgi:hypothetical protein
MLPSADVFNDDRPSERAFHALGKHPRNYIGRATCRQRHDQRDELRRIRLRISVATWPGSAAAPAARGRKCLRPSFIFIM